MQPAHQRRSTKQQRPLTTNLHVTCHVLSQKQHRTSAQVQVLHDRPHGTITITLISCLHYNEGRIHCVHEAQSYKVYCFHAQHMGNCTECDRLLKPVCCFFQAVTEARFFFFPSTRACSSASLGRMLPGSFSSSDSPLESSITSSAFCTAATVGIGCAATGFGGSCST